MSHSIDERYAAYVERRSRANKDHKCDACHRAIARRAEYYRVTWVFDGSAGGCKRCLACQITHEHLRVLCRERGDMWPDERLACGLDYADEWDTEPPPEIAALAFWDGNPASLPFAWERCTYSRHYDGSWSYHHECQPNRSYWGRVPVNGQAIATTRRVPPEAMLCQ